jgi:hypothetical protein
MASKISRANLLQIENTLENMLEPLHTTIRALESISTERVPRAKDPAFQDELNKTHAAFTKCIKASLAFLNNQMGIKQEFKALMARDNVDQTELDNALLKTTSRVTLILEQYRRDTTEWERLKNKIAELAVQLKVENLIVGQSHNQPNH